MPVTLLCSSGRRQQISRSYLSTTPVCLLHIRVASVVESLIRLREGIMLAHLTSP